jgi:hypothetical protein
MTDRITIAKTEITMLQRELISWNSVVLCGGKGRGEIEQEAEGDVPRPRLHYSYDRLHRGKFREGCRRV